MKGIVAVILVSLALTGCGAGLITAQAGGEVQRTLTCECPPDKALNYAITASRQIGMNPLFINPTGFNVTTSDMFGASAKVLNVLLQSKDSSTTEIMVRAKSSGGAEKLANEYTAAFEKVSKP